MTPAPRPGGEQPSVPWGMPTGVAVEPRTGQHREEVIRIARTGASYVLTTGTGSGKSLASAHKTEAVRELLGRSGFPYRDLPPYAPDLNPTVRSAAPSMPSRPTMPGAAAATPATPPSEPSRNAL